MPPELSSPATAYFREFQLGIALALSREPMARSTRTQTAQSVRRTAMVTRVLSITTAVVSLAVSAAVAASLTDQMQSTRMTVVQVDKSAGKFLCAEHRKWTAVSAADLKVVGAGDIVKVERRDGQPSRIIVLRHAADELSSPEL
jgi:hypothetical protein